MHIAATFDASFKMKSSKSEKWQSNSSFISDFIHSYLELGWIQAQAKSLYFAFTLKEEATKTQ